MNKIIVSICGVGMGHAARESALITELKKNNEVIVTTYGEAFNYLKEFNPVKIQGFKIIYLNGVYNELLSILSNIPFFPFIVLKNFFVFNKLKKEFKPDLIVSDYDVFSLYFSRLCKIPCVLISNMHGLKYSSLKKKHPHKDSSLITGVLGLLPFAFFNYLFVLSLRKKQNTEKIRFYSMIVKPEILKAKPKDKNFYLVYSNEKQLKTIIPLLEKINEKFIVFGLKGKAENIEFHEKYSKKLFAEKLIECKAILSHGGYSLMSEAIHLKKPIYSFTSARFYERFFNGATIQEMGFGLIEETPSINGLNEFFSRINEFKKNILNSGISDESKKIAEEINELIKKNK
jgi:uncharacterized protein (TIGR00661 family)